MAQMSILANKMKLLCGVAAVTLLSACDQPFDFDLRDLANGFDTSNAVQNIEPRPKPDNRGVISYPNYQVAVAKRGDTVTSVAQRLGISPTELARYNGISADTQLRDGEVIALPGRVSEPSPATGAATTGPIQPAPVDVTTLAGNAIDNAAPTTPSAQPATTAQQQVTGVEPIRHKVERGETAYSIARLYGIPAKTLAEWNGLSGDLAVREGQFLLVPVTNTPVAAAPASVSEPGSGTTTPTPPSATKPLPAATTTVAAAPAPKVDAPDLSSTRTQASASSAKFVFPTSGNIIRAYKKGTNDGIDIGASAGAAVKAADAGTVAAITSDTDQVPIIVVKHANNILTVYANVDGIKVKKGDKVSRGQTIAAVRSGSPSFLHFEVRKGFESVDPTTFLP